MTAITGYKCDVCGSFDTERAGWMKLEIHGTHAAGDPGFSDICSNLCLTNLAVARLREIDGVEYGARKKATGRKEYVQLSPDEKLVVLARADEVGAAQAAEEYGVAVSTIRTWKRGAA